MAPKRNKDLIIKSKGITEVPEESADKITSPTEPDDSSTPLRLKPTTILETLPDPETESKDIITQFRVGDDSEFGGRSSYYYDNGDRVSNGTALHHHTIPPRGRSNFMTQHIMDRRAQDIFTSPPRPTPVPGTVNPEEGGISPKKPLKNLFDLIQQQEGPIRPEEISPNQPLFSIEGNYDLQYSPLRVGGEVRHRIIKLGNIGSETIRYSESFASSKKNHKYRIKFDMKYTIRELTPNTNITFFRPTAEGLLGEQSLGDDKETESFYTIVSDDFGTFNKFKTFVIDFESKVSDGFIFQMQTTDLVAVFENLEMYDLGLVEEFGGLVPNVKPEDDEGDSEEEEDDSTGDLIDDSVTNFMDSEEVSENFGVPDVEIEQTLFQSFDVFSGLDIDTDIFDNTRQGYLDSNRDGRIGLGLFTFSDDNILQDDFPNIIGNQLFRQLPRRNLVVNGNCKFVQSKYNNELEIGGNESNFGDGAVLLPEGDWGYLTWDGVNRGPDGNQEGNRPDEMYANNLAGEFPYDTIQGVEFKTQFNQSDDFGLYPDNQLATGYSGWLDYHSLLNLQRKLQLAKDTAPTEADVCNTFLKLVQQSTGSFDARFTPEICNTDLFGNQLFVNFANWRPGGYSFNRSLTFLADDFTAGQFDTNGDNENDLMGVTFDWSESDKLLGQSGNQYRTLNQCTKIYEGGDKSAVDEQLLPNTLMEVKFKIRSFGTTPSIEVAVVDADGSVESPQRTDDIVNQYGYVKNFHYWPKGDFNTRTYSDDINTPGTLDKKTSNFGSRIKVNNSQAGSWEIFTYQFVLNDSFRYNSTGKIRDLWLVIQAGSNFKGKMQIDDIECYESGDFIPDVDVRKKISVGNYGKADLTKYYDKELQPDEYRDSQAPLEAQFYFYPTYPSDEIFDVKRTPIYNDFKKGLFYIYDVDWGDGSPKEFTSEPEQIDEETSLYHTYKKSGVFEVTGYMIRMKGDVDGEAQGILKNKKFRLYINVNEGRDEDFTYFGSDEGFSYIPLKNTTPMVGGFSNQSTYFKSIYRQLGFFGGGFETVDSGSLLEYNESFFTPTQLYPYASASGDGNDNFLMQDDYPYMQDLFDTDGDGIPDVGFPVGITADDATVNHIIEILGVGLDNYTGTLEYYEDSGFNIIWTLGWNEDANEWEYKHFEDTFDGDVGSGDWGPTNYFITKIVVSNTFDLTLPLKTFVEFGNDSDKLKTELALLKMKSKDGDFNYIDFLDILPNYTKERTDSNGEVVNRGLQVLQEEFGQGIGDTDITNIKYYNTAISIWELLGFSKVIGQQQIIDEFFPGVASMNFFYEGHFNPSLNNETGETGTVLFVKVFGGEYAGESMAYYPNFGWFGPLQYRPLDGYRNPIEGYRPGDVSANPYVQIKNTSDTIYEFEVDAFGPNSSYTLEILHWFEYYGPGNYSEMKSGNSMTILPGQTMEIILPISKITTIDVNYTAEEVAKPDNPRYWKNIIPKDYSILNRDMFDESGSIDTYKEQDWLDENGDGQPDYYYPVLPKYGRDGKFVQVTYDASGSVESGVYPNDKIPFPLNGPLTDESEQTNNLLINLINEPVETNVIDDSSGNNNLGFTFSDYKPIYSDEKLEPKRRKITQMFKTSAEKGAF
jgi:hypothetical protein